MFFDISIDPEQVSDWAVLLSADCWLLSEVLSSFQLKLIYQLFSSYQESEIVLKPYILLLYVLGDSPSLYVQVIVLGTDLVGKSIFLQLSLQQEQRGDHPVRTIVLVKTA